MWWNMFASYGTIELYILYKMMENQEAQNAGIEDVRTNPDLSKFE
jgi:hypothetical protein